VPSPVGCFPLDLAACGTLDMAGNVKEWMATSIGEPHSIEPRKDFTTAEGVLLSYGAFFWDKERLCCGARGWDLPGTWNLVLGFRVVWTLRSSE